MSSTVKPVPSSRYQMWQRELWRLHEFSGGTARNAVLSIEEQLETEFMHAWGFSDENEEQAYEMEMMARRNCRRSAGGFDHCTCYFEPETKSHIVVTQPYARTSRVVESLTRNLTLLDEMKPEIIAAPEWAFYYPGRATLVLLKFPPRYGTVLEALDRLWSPGAKWSLSDN